MKKLLLGAAALVAFAAPACAADIAARPYAKAPAYTAPQVVYNWTGFYIGGHLGGAFAGGNSLLGNDARFLGGVQGGFDYQFAGNWVVGAEAQYSWLANNNNGVLFPGGTLVTSNNNQLGSVTGRFGYLFAPQLLGYVKGGGAWARIDTTHFATVPPPTIVSEFATGQDRQGWTIGAGLEWMFAPGWSVFGEYNYMDFGTKTVGFTTGPLAVGVPSVVSTRLEI